MATTAALLPPTSIDLKREESPAVTVSEIKPTAGAPPGFKLVKVKKPDGTVVTVKRPIVPVPKPTPTGSAAEAIVQKPATIQTVAGGSQSSTAPSISSSSPVSQKPGPTPTSTESKALPVDAAAPTKKKWYSGIKKGVSNLNVDKMASALESIEQATTRIDAALTGKPIPPKTTPTVSKPSVSAGAKPPAAVSKSVTAASSAPAPPATTGSVVLSSAPAHNTTPVTGPSTNTILLATSASPAPLNAAAQTLGSGQPSSSVNVNSSAPAQVKPASQTPPSAQLAPTSLTKAPANVTQPPPKQPQAVHPAQVRPPSQAPATRGPLAPLPPSGSSPAHTFSSDALLGTAGASIIGTSAVDHSVQRPSTGPTPPTRNVGAAPSHTSPGTHQDYQTQNYGQAQHPSDATRDIPGTDYSGVAEGALGGAAVGAGGGLAYEEYEDYASGDDVVEDEEKAPTEEQSTTTPEDEVYEDYNPEEDEVVQDNPAQEAEAGNESDGTIEEYDPENDELVEDGSPDVAMPEDVENQPDAEYAHSDAGQPEDLELETENPEVEPQHDMGYSGEEDNAEYDNY